MSTSQTPYAFTLESRQIFNRDGYELRFRVDSTITVKTSNQHGDRGDTHGSIVDIEVHEITDMTNGEDMTDEGLANPVLMAEIREYVEARESYIMAKVG